MNERIFKAIGSSMIRLTGRSKQSGTTGIADEMFQLHISGQVVKIPCAFDLQIVIKHSVIMINIENKSAPKLFTFGLKVASKDSQVCLPYMLSRRTPAEC